MRKVNADVKNKDFAPVYLIFGDESYLRENYRNSLLKALVTPGDTLNYNSFSGDGIDPREIVSLAVTLPFMAEHRVIYIKDSGFFKKAAEKITEYIEDPSPTTVVIFEESAIDKNTRAYKAVHKAGYDVEAKKYDEEKLPDWIAANFKRNGKKVSRETVDLLIERAGRDMSSLDAEIKKVSSFAGDRDSVTSEDVKKLVTRSPSYSVFQMIDAIGDRKLNTAIGIYYDMMVEQQNVYGVFSLIARQFRIMLSVSDMMKQGVDPAEIAEAVHVSYKQVFRYSKQAKKFPRAKMVRAIDECVRAPREIAQGKLDKNAAVELLIIGIASG